jgi:hypothetical protein
VEQERRELGELLITGGSQGEKDLLAQFTEAFAEFSALTTSCWLWRSRTPTSRRTAWPLARPPPRSMR